MNFSQPLHVNRYYFLYVDSRESSEAGIQLFDLLTFKLHRVLSQIPEHFNISVFAFGQLKLVMFLICVLFNFKIKRFLRILKSH